MIKQQQPDRLPWQRYCVPRGEEWPSDSGFLFDPESEHAKYFGAKPISLAELRTKRALVLLGEAGIGKSDTLQQECEQCKQSYSSASVLLIDLHGYGQGSDGRLLKDIFESEQFLACSSGARTLFLFLDSFDECRMDMKHLSAFLSGELKKRQHVAPHLYVRIACRGAMWPSELEETLKQVWPDDDVGVYELCPLRRQDVALKARRMNLDEQTFLDEVTQREVETLASRPKTLNYLLVEFSQHGRLPKTKTELFEQACLRLCAEDPRREQAGRKGKLTPKQHLRISSRIAAAIIFGGNTGIWLGGSLEPNRRDSDLSLNDLIGDEREETTAFPVTLEALDETLTISGLLSQRDSQRVEFEHQSDAEFLAALYVHRSGVSATQSLPILRHAEDSKIIPQLYDTAAWLASLDQNVFSAIAATEPEVLLSGDFAAADNAGRRLVVTRLLDREEHEVHSTNVSAKALYKLAHPDLHDQLLPFITSSNWDQKTRSLAIDIAVACSVASLQLEILTIALNRNESIHLRVNAAHAIQKIGDHATRQLLRPLARGECGDDPGDRLKGVALATLWPDYMDSTELFALLDSRHDSNNIGTFHMFVRHELAKSLRPEHLPNALRWIAAQPASNERAFAFRDIVPEIMRLAWQHLDAPNVLPEFSQAALALMRRHEPLFFWRGESSQDDLLGDTSKRQRFLDALIPLLAGPDDQHIAWGLARSDDVTWLLGLYSKTPDIGQRENIAYLLNGVIQRERTPASVSAIIDRCSNPETHPNEPLPRVFEYLTRVWNLEDDWVSKVRSQWLKQKQWEKESEPVLMDPLPEERVLDRLKSIESGNIDAWPSLAVEMTLEPTDRFYDGFPNKLFDQPGWRDADETTRARILDAALNYLRLGENPPDDIDTRQAYSMSDVAGGFAIELLAVAAPHKLDELTTEDFSKWSLLLVAYSFEHAVEQLLLQKFFERAPHVLRATLLKHVTNRGRTQPDILHLQSYDCVWSDALGQDLFGLLDDSSFPNMTRDKVLEFLLRHHFRPARDFAAALVNSRESHPDERETAAALLLRYHSTGRAQLLSRLLHSDTEFARAVFLKLVTPRAHDDDSSFFELEDESMADAYVWLEQQFSHRSDPEHENAYTPQARDHIATFRNNVLGQLTRRGTLASCSAIERITQVFPDYDWLRRCLDDARRNARNETWTPPTIRQVFDLCADRNARLIRSEQELLDAVLESLARLQERLRGKTPLAPFLWNEPTDARRKSGNKAVTHERKPNPKNENRLSDFVKTHLANDLNRRGILVNREVEVHNWKGKGRGNCVDILVQTVTNDSETLTVVVESKGCWNTGLETQMETQLKQEYMAGAGHRCGVYLAGWFGPDFCKSNHLSLKALKRHLETQAKTLSHDGETLRAFVLDVSLRLAKKTSKAAHPR